MYKTQFEQRLYILVEIYKYERSVHERPGDRRQRVEEVIGGGKGGRRGGGET